MEKTQKVHKMYLVFNSDSSNEYFARTVVASFISRLDPTVSEMTDVKTAVSEAVTNSIIHGYEEGEGDIYLRCFIEERTLRIEIWDEGKGIGDIEKARQPLYTSKPDLERSGMGFTVMETFMDEVLVESGIGLGTKIIMKKTFDQFS